MKTKIDKEDELERIKGQYSPELGDMVCDLFESGFTRGEIGEIMLREIAKIAKDLYEK